MHKIRSACISASGLRSSLLVNLAVYDFETQQVKLALLLTVKTLTGMPTDVEAPARKWCDFLGAFVWHRFWRPAAARTGPYGQPLFGGKCERFPIMCRSGAGTR
jgi:hypothetical protein